MKNIPNGFGMKGAKQIVFDVIPAKTTKSASLIFHIFNGFLQANLKNIQRFACQLRAGVNISV